MARGNRLLQAAINLAKSRKKPKIPVFSILGGEFGPAGRLLGGLIDVFRVGGRVSQEDVSRSKTVMEEAGLPLTPSGIRVVDLREWASSRDWIQNLSFWSILFQTTELRCFPLVRLKNCLQPRVVCQDQDPGRQYLTLTQIEGERSLRWSRGCVK